MTFFVSAFWHGFYFGFYGFFGGLMLMSFAWKMVPRTVLAQKVVETVPYPLIWLVNWWICFSCISLFGMSYVFYFWSCSLQMWNNCYWFGHIGLTIAIIISAVLPKARRKPKVADNKAKEATTPTTAESTKKSQ